MDKASEIILALKPVTFHYKSELDPEGIPQFGLVAEEVAKVDPALVARDDQGKPYTVRYEAVNAMLLNEFLKEHRKVGKLEETVVQQQKDFQATIAEQQQEIKALTASLKEQASQIQKASAQLHVSRPAPQTVVNNQ
jgi:predicted ribosome quality control (RQC) complex YloA/Tae2 family protein